MENESFRDDNDKLNHRRTNGADKKVSPPPTYQEEWPGKNKNGTNTLEVVTTFEDAASPEKQTCGEVWRDYPKSVIFIFGNEFCERFSYYGMKAILTLYLRNVLLYPRNVTSALYSAFVMICYFSPIFGSILADGYIGKFHTIMWVSLFYAAGNVIIAVAASFAIGASVHPWLDFIGLIVIGLGTGGIKPCVQPFGGDQFRKGQERQLAQFFSIFYFAINAGSCISIILTPILRTTPCQDQSTCYPLAFGIPAALMVIAVIFFAMGSFWYKKVPPQGNVFAKIAKVVGTALSNKRTFEVKREHWLDHYMDSHNCSCDEECRDAGRCMKAQFVTDIKAVLRVLLIYVPLPIFWALYEQQGSTWVLQATQMNPEIAPGVYFLPDQISVLNAVLIMVLIPIFTLGIYPLVGKCVKVTPLRKMCAGCFLAGVAYIVCMLIQFQIRDTLPQYPTDGQTLLTVTNYVQGCKDIRVIGTDDKNKPFFEKTLNFNESELFPLNAGQINWDFAKASGDCDWIQKQVNGTSLELPGTQSGYVIFSDIMDKIKFRKTQMIKSDSGEAVLTVNVNFLADYPPGVNTSNFMIAFCKGVIEKNCTNRDQAVYKEFKMEDRVSVPKKPEDQNGGYVDMPHGVWGIHIVGEGETIPLNVNFTQNANGGIFSVTILPDKNNPGGYTVETVRQAPDSVISVLWQVPQYFVISVAEILFSITGYEFAYSQAPLSMKSVVFALYLLTDAVGNVIILIISLFSVEGFDMSWIFLIYACLMFVVFVIFIFIAIRYKYTLYVRDEDEDNKATN